MFPNAAFILAPGAKLSDELLQHNRGFLAGLSCGRDQRR